MLSATFEFDRFEDEFTLLPDAHGCDWPSLQVQLDYVLHPPEPDVGIFGYTIETQKVTYYLDDTAYVDGAAFVAAVYAAIAGDIDDDATYVADRIRQQIDEWERACEVED